MVLCLAIKELHNFPSLSMRVVPLVQPWIHSTSRGNSLDETMAVEPEFNESVGLDSKARAKAIIKCDATHKEKGGEAQGSK